MRLIEVIEGEDTSPETVQAAVNFAQAIRKTAIRCGEAPGFVVNRILNSSVSELWRVQEETGIDVKEIDRIVAESKAAPVGPFYPRRPARPRHRAARRRAPAASPTAIASTCTSGCASWSPTASSARRPGRASMSTDADADRPGWRCERGVPAAAALVERFTLKALVESCLVLEEGIASMQGHRPRDDGRRRHHPAAVRARRPARARRGARRGSSAPPREWGEGFEPPTILRRLVAQGRLGVKTGQGFFPYAAARRGLGGEPGQARDARRGRDRVARPPAGELDLARGRATRCARLWDAVRSAGTVRALVFASANPMLFCAGADIKAFTTMDEAAGQELLDRMHALLREMETRAGGDDRRRQRGRARRRLRAGDGVRSPDRGGVGDVRPARDQPRDHPRLRRNAAAAAAGRRGAGAAS